MSRSGYNRLKRCDFRRWRNKDSDWADVVSCGRAFQIRGPATVKARLPTVESLTEGTDRRLVPAERSARRPGRSATGTRGPRYRGALPRRALYVSSQHGDFIFNPLWDSQPVKTDKRVSDVVRGCHVVDQPCRCVQYRL